ncbi:MAG: peptidoglycan-binding protein, partial [Pseudanabaena sp. ELA748]
TKSIMELLAYIQEEFVQPDLISEQNDIALNLNLNLKFKTWLQQLTTKSAKLSLNVILAGTTILIGLGSTLNALAIETPSSDIKYVQSLLAKNGFDPGAIDGVAGLSTKNAILRAQKAFGLNSDGIVGSQTIAALEGKTTTNEAIALETTKSPAVVSVNETTRSSSVVMNLQKLLSDRGFYNGTVDGLMGSQTRTAIIEAQKAYKLPPDGVAGPQTLAALESDTAKTTSVSSTTTKSAEVTSLQDLLSKRGFYNGPVDGIMGPQTRLAIVAAQKNYGLTTDGIAGSQTIAALESNPNKTEVPASATSESKTSSKSDKDVLALQELLAKRGFYNGAIDGIKGSQTSTAIASAQKAYGLVIDGIAGAKTIAALQSDAKPAPKNTTQAANTANDDGVANLQNLLTDRGFYNGPITGVLGSRTKEAIIAAQKAYGLTADGVAGSRTIAALESGVPRPQVAVIRPTVVSPTVVSPAVTPTIRVETKPQVPQVAVKPIVQATPKPQVAVVPQPTVQATPKPQVAVVPQPTAPATSSNGQVSQLQTLLAQRGFYTGKVDGVMSGETRNAIVRAQNFYTISPADGLPSNKLVDSLTKDTFISEGN